MNLDLEWPWAPAVVAGVTLLGLLVWSRRGRRASAAPLVVARVERLRRLPRFQRMLVTRRRLAAAAVVASLVVVAGAAVVLARPEVVEEQPREARNRDLMLCLDASPSMARDNRAVVRETRRIAERLRGDRIGLVIWSGAAVLVFPLTDDADYVLEQLDRADAAFAGDPQRFYAGTTLNDAGQSLIGDGLVSCVNRFDAGGDRTRAVLLASDNEPFGDRLYDLPEAAAYAEERDVLVYGIAATRLSQPKRAEALEELRTAVRSTGGTLAELGDPGGAERLVARIDDLEKARAAEPPRRVSRDAPTLGVALTGAGTLALAAAWLAGWLVARGERRRRST